MKVSISKALKLKNRLGSRMKKSQARIIEWNSNPVDKKVPVNVGSEYDELMKLRALVRNVSVAIYQSNSSICALLKEMSELKQHIVFLSSIDTKEGLVHPSRYSDRNEPVEYEVSLNYEYVEEIKERAERRVREIQDLLDEHNATTKIEIDDRVGDYK